MRYLLHCAVILGVGAMVGYNAMHLGVFEAKMHTAAASPSPLSTVGFVALVVTPFLTLAWLTRRRPPQGK